MLQHGCVEDIMPSEISQTQKDKYWGTSSSQIHRDRKENGGYQGPGEEGDGELLFNGYRVPRLTVVQQYKHI